MVDLTRLFAIGRLAFLIPFLRRKKLPLVLVDGGDEEDDDDDVVVDAGDVVSFSVATFPSISQSSILPILIAIESLSVDTRLP